MAKTSLQLLQIAIEKIESQPVGRSHFTNDANVSEIQTAQNDLDVTFDAGYRLYIERLGAGSFGFLEVYGVRNPQGKQFAINDLRTPTLALRQLSTGSLSDDCYVVSDGGDGSY